MPTNAAADNRTVGTNGRIDEQLTEVLDAISTALETAGADETAIESVEAAGQSLVEAVEEIDTNEETDDVAGEDEQASADTTEDQPPEDDLREQVAGLTERVDDLEQSTDFHLDDICDLEVATRDLEDRVSTLEDRSSGDELDPEQETNHRSGDRIEPQTPLEDVARLPSRLTEDQSPNVRRALFVARDVVQYTRSVPAGRAIKWSELRQVLRAGTDCNAHPQTVKRVMETLDDFGEDTVEIVDRDDREKLICFDEEATARLDHLCSEDQSVDATHDVVSRSEG